MVTKIIISILLLYIYTHKGRRPAGTSIGRRGRLRAWYACAYMVAGALERSGVAGGGDAGDVELRRVALRPGGGLLLRRLVEERPAAPSPPVAAPAGAVRRVVVSGREAEAVHAYRRRLLRAPGPALLPRHMARRCRHSIRQACDDDELL